MTADDAWVRLLPDYEARRAREDSLDRLVEWGAQRALTAEQKERYPHKQAWMARYVGIIIFRAVPCG